MMIKRLLRTLPCLHLSAYRNLRRMLQMYATLINIQFTSKIMNTLNLLLAYRFGITLLPNYRKECTALHLTGHHKLVESGGA